MWLAKSMYASEAKGQRISASNDTTKAVRVWCRRAIVEFGEGLNFEKSEGGWERWFKP